MTDFEKVVKGLSACIDSYKTCQKGSCPYKNLPDEYSCSDELMKDALALLKECEFVKHGRWIETENDKVISRISGYCSSCGWEAHLYEDDVIGMPYCPNCGAKMDDDDKDMIYKDYLRMRAISEDDILAITDWIEKKRKEIQRLCDALKPAPPKEGDECV